MKKKFLIQLCITFTVLIIFSSCSKEPGHENYDHGNKVNTFKGPEVQMGNGKVRSWISINHDGFPLVIGIEITDAALNGLPQDPLNFQAATFILPLHQKAKAITPFDHIVINWNVHGHEPEHVFDVPHFDFHFYMISLQDQMAIPPYEVAPAAFDNLPPNNYWPDLYVPTPGGVPQMGKHWINTTFAPPFTKTLIYGSYSGKFTFVEPMITRDFLLQGTSYSEIYPQPHVFVPTNKFYPTKYNVYKDPVSEKHYVTLSDFVWR